MKFDTSQDIFIVISFFIPGFIYDSIIRNFVPLRRNKEKELQLLRFLTATAFNYALCSPLIYLLISGAIFRRSIVGQASTWLVILAVVPAVIALIHAKLVQRDGFAKIWQWLGLRSINPIPTGWERIFSRTEPCFVVVRMTDGSEVAGWFGERSLASSDTERKDIYLELVYRIDEDSGE